MNASARMAASTARRSRPSSTATTNTSSKPRSSSIEAAGEGEITLLSMAPTNAPETLRKALAMGATRAVHVTDPALAGSDHVSTAKVLAAALGTLEYDMVFAGIDSSDGVGGVVPAAIAAHLGLAVPLVRREDRARYGEPDRPCPAHQRDRLRRARGTAPR